jgi:uncharacterized protein (UPF0264 family)
LLVSVRNRSEAILALRAGVDLIDIKEPRAGSLGAASSGVIREIVSLCSGKVPLSVALGELLTAEGECELPAAADIQFAKLGLAGCRAEHDWHQRWDRRIERLSSPAAAVAVIYADWLTAGAPPPAEVLAHAVRTGCRAVLLDTFDKSQGSLFAHLPLAQTTDLVGDIHRLGLPAVVAGSLSVPMIGQLIEAGADCLAFRGAACRGGRTGSVDALLLRDIVHAVRSQVANGGRLARPFVGA